MTDSNRTKRTHRIRRHARVRSRIIGTAERPRVSVFKSSQHVYAQAVDDAVGKTVAAVNDAHVKAKKGSKTDHAMEAGRMLAALLKKAGIAAVVFDKGGFRYHGRVKAVADGLREGGIQV